MACFHPLKGFRALDRNESGKYSITFNPTKGYTDLPLTIPCGQCIGCRLERSRQWAIRCVHEASLHDRNCFITLTFNDENLDKQKSLNKKDFQDFMKRFRKKTGLKIRYFHCGEYGTNYSRPHHHAAIFGYDFPDKTLHRDNGEIQLYTSKILSELWPYGYHTIGDLTFDSAAYVARYITKKITGDHAIWHYNDIDTTTGEIINERIPEYTTMSRRPGIGKKWLEKYTTDIYNFDHVILNGKELKPPKYYDKIYMESHPEEFEKIKVDRKHKNLQALANQTTERLEVREQCAKLNMRDKQKRSYEDGI